MRNPRVFLFDEPLSNLDAKLRVQMRTEIKRVHQAVRTTTIYVTHDQVEAMTLADRVVVMNGGVIEQVGPPQELYHRPRTRFVAGFIGSPAMNFLPATLDGAGLRLEDGQVLPLPDARATRYAGHDGAVLLGIRPEHMAEFARPGSAPLQIVVDVVEPMGMETMIHFRVAGTPTVARVAPETPAQPGAPLGLHLDMNQMHLVDPQTNQVI